VSERDCPAWYHEDNVFRTRRRMDHAHRPIVALACRTLRGRGGDVIDLGCGNGALVAKIHALEPRVTPFGVERDPLRVAHARALLPEFADHFFAADLGAHPLLESERRFALAILSPRRLQEAGPAASERLRTWLRARCERLLVYAYGSGRTEFGDLAGFARSVGLELEGGEGTARAALARRW
jgi:SAM-dependent methyltransferase